MSLKQIPLSTDIVSTPFPSKSIANGERVSEAVSTFSVVSVIRSFNDGKKGCKKIVVINNKETQDNLKFRMF